MAVLGCIADDFTGASDAASFLVKGGMSVRLFNGIPDRQVTEMSGEGWDGDRTGRDGQTDRDRADRDGQKDESQAIVIALKSRTQETGQAVADSLTAAHFLLDHGVKQIYFKYCSTFDSTPQGNIGPVADALMDLMKVPYTLLCPALPVNGRTVENGKLMVNGVLLHESHMKNHPLTPMWDSRIDQLMKPQSRYSCRCLDMNDWKSEEPAGNREPFYFIPDYVKPEDGERIAAAFGHLPFLTGGSGLLEPLARLWTKKLSSHGIIPENAAAGKALLLAGSCSKATLEQIAWYQNQGHPAYRLDPREMLEGRQTVEDAWRFVEQYGSSLETVLVYSSDTPEKVREYQKLGTEKVAAMLEGATAELAVRAVKAGYTRIISAGGETSGAVTKGLGFSSYWMGESVAPGVPIMVPAERPDIRLILKSGNFGQEDFFGRALAMTEKH